MASPMELQLDPAQDADDLMQRAYRERFGLAVVLAAALGVAGCATPSLVLEAEHVSHPTVGQPFGSSYEREWANGYGWRRAAESQLTQVSALLRWRKADWYLDAGLGFNAFGNNGGDFRGPPLTGTIRVGREIHLVRK